MESEPAHEENRAVRVGLDKVKGVSRRAATDIIAERERGGAFATLRNLLDRVRLASNEVTALVLCGACDGLAPLDAADYPFAHEAALERLQQKSDQLELEGLSPQRSQRTRAAATAGAGDARVKLYQALVRAKNELAYLEMHLSAHPTALLREEAERYGCLPISQVVEAEGDSALRLAAIVAAMRRVPTGQGPMQFITFEDETGLLEAVVFPAVYKRLGERVTTPGPFLVEGRVRREQGAVHLEVTGLGPFHEREGAYGVEGGGRRRR